MVFRTAHVVMFPVDISFAHLPNCSPHPERLVSIQKIVTYKCVLYQRKEFVNQSHYSPFDCGKYAKMALYMQMERNQRKRALFYCASFQQRCCRATLIKVCELETAEITHPPPSIAQRSAKETLRPEIKMYKKSTIKMIYNHSSNQYQ